MHRAEAAEGGEGHAELVWSVEWKRRVSQVNMDSSWKEICAQGRKEMEQYLAGEGFVLR